MSYANYKKAKIRGDVESDIVDKMLFRAEWAICHFSEKTTLPAGHEVRNRLLGELFSYVKSAKKEA